MPRAHRIVEVEQRTVDTTYPRVVGRNARLGGHGSGGPTDVVILHTASGHRGWGVLTDSQAPVDALLGRRCDDMFDPAVGVTDDSVRAFDFALHDLAARIEGVPVYQLLGAAADRATTCYDGAIYFDDLDPDTSPRGVPAVVANCAADQTLGFTAFKLKIGRGQRWLDRAAGDAADIEVTRAVRAAYPDARLLVDANDGYDCAGIIAYLDAVADCDLYWLEEPFPDDADDLATLRTFLRAAGSTTLVAEGETDPDVPLLLELAGAGLIDVLLMDVVSFGFTAWRRLMPQLIAAGVAVSPHAWGRPLKTLYAATLAAGVGNIPTVEGVPGTTLGVDTSAYRLVDGRLTVPDAPGFGMTFTG